VRVCVGVTEIFLNRELQGTVALETDISRVDSTTGMLKYLGYNIHDLAAYAYFKEDVYLLLYQHLPKRSELMAFRTNHAGRWNARAKQYTGRVVSFTFVHAPLSHLSNC
jgi:citrate synthase